MVFLSSVTVVVGLALVLPLYRVLAGPSVYDRMVGVTVAGTKTIVLICLVGVIVGRADMFLDIAMAYAMLNFTGALVVAKYLDHAEGDPH